MKERADSHMESKGGEGNAYLERRRRWEGRGEEAEVEGGGGQQIQ